MVSRIVSDASEVITFVFEVITSAVTIVVNIAAALFFSLSHFGSPVCGFSGVYSALYFSNIMFKKSLQGIEQASEKYGDALSSFHIDTLGHIPEIKAYCLEEEWTEKYQKLIQEGWFLQKKQLFLEIEQLLCPL